MSYLIQCWTSQQIPNQDIFWLCSNDAVRKIIAEMLDWWWWWFLDDDHDDDFLMMVISIIK